MEEKSINRNGFSFPRNNAAKAILWGLYPIAVFFAASLIVSIIFTVAVICNMALTGQELDIDRCVEQVFSYYGYLNATQQLLTLGATLPLFLVHKKYLPKPEKKNSIGKIFYGVVFALGCTAVISILQTIIFNLFSIHDSSWIETQGLILSMPLWLQIVSVVILAPIVEEIMFRGMLLNRLASRFPKWVAVVVSAALFGIIHLNWSQGIFAGLGGLVFGFLYVKTRSLWLCIFAHAANNLYATLLSLVQWSDITHAYLADVVLAFVTLIPVFVVWFVKRNKTPQNVDFSDSV